MILTNFSIALALLFEASWQNSQSDTLLHFQFQNQSIQMRASWSFAQSRAAFQELLKQPVDSLKFKETVLIDVTGDGRLDSCLSQIFVKRGNVYVLHTISDSGTIIWRDEFKIRDLAAFTLSWDQDSSYFKLKPYSSFHIARSLYSKFVYESIDTGSVDFKTISDIVYSLLSGGNENAKRFWKKYLGTFKGRLVLTMDEVNPNAYIWDSRRHKFVLYYAP